MLDVIIVNQRTMHIVQGHQRLAALDSLEKNQEYGVVCAVCDLDEKTEKEQNIFMNNPKAQGEFDTEMFGSLLHQIDIFQTGFDPADVAMMGVEIDLSMYRNDTQEEAKKLADEMKDIEQELKPKNPDSLVFEESGMSGNDFRKKLQNITNENNIENVDLFVVLTFTTHDAKRDFMQRFGFGEFEKYIKGEMFSDMIEVIQQEE